MTRITKTQKNRIRVFFLLVIILLACWLPYWLAYYPGNFCYDVNQQWEMYFLADHPFTEWHPILHTLIMCGIFDFFQNVLGSITRAVAVYMLIQLFCLALVSSYAICYFSGLTKKKWVLVVFTICFAVYPTLPILAVSTTKDVFFSIFFLWAFVELAKSIQKKKIRWLLPVTLVLAILFRTNMIYAVIAMLAFLAIALLVYGSRHGFKREKGNVQGKRLLLLLVTMACALLVGKGLLLGLSYATEANPVHVCEKYSQPCQQIAYVYQQHKDDMPEEMKNEILTYWSEEILDTYNRAVADPIKFFADWSVYYADPDRFNNLWISVLKSYPKDCLIATARNMEALWNPLDTSLIEARARYWETLNFTEFDGIKLAVGHYSKFPALYEWIEEVNKGADLIFIPGLSLFFVPASYVWLAIFSWLFLAIHPKKRKSGNCWLAIYILTYVLTLLVGPCVLPRYVMNVVITAPFLLIFLIRKEEPEQVDS